MLNTWGMKTLDRERGVLGNVEGTCLREVGARVTEGFRTQGSSHRQRISLFQVLETIQALERALGALPLSYTPSPEDSF